ncbi:hypothetical protein [uncultured Dokdonia sp.]|uniref:hypothetical protein n=1 Tax=uncultured Dokdonia sp. TaxID=575653 RepID=UPI0026246AC0|nr:hypothetical protein [uncultured Dokdonia sp.]
MKTNGRVLVVVAILIAVFITIGIYSNREVISAFDKINQKLEVANSRSRVANDSLLSLIQDDSPFKFGAMITRDIAQEFYEDIERYKLSLLKDEIGGDYSKGAVETTIFIKDGVITEHGTSFIAAMKQMREVFITNSDEDTLVLSKIQEFYDSEVANSKEKSEAWLRYHFEGFPVISSVAKLSSIQNDVKAIENQILTNVLSQKIPSAQ